MSLMSQIFGWIGPSGWDEQASRENQAKDAQFRHSILQEGGGVLFAWSSIAPGSYGYALRGLEMEGVLKSTYEQGATPDLDRWRFTLTKNETAPLSQTGLQTGT